MIIKYMKFFITNLLWPIINFVSAPTNSLATYGVVQIDFTYLLNETLPLKLTLIKLHQTNYKPWLTTAILNSVKKKNKICKHFIKLYLLNLDKHILCIKII